MVSPSSARCWSLKPRWLSRPAARAAWAMSLKGPTEVQRGTWGTLGIWRATFSAAADANGVGNRADVCSVDAEAGVGATVGPSVVVDVDVGVGSDDHGPDG